MIPPLVVVVISAIGIYLVTRPELAAQPRLWLYLLLAELPLAGMAVFSLWRSSRLKARLLPQSGDVFLGVLTATALIIAAWAGRYLIMPHGSPRNAWLARMYLQLGDPSALEQTWWMPLVLIVGPILDELVWRAWLQDRLSARLGSTRGLLLTTGLYALAATPTLFTLADPAVGTNVLFPLLAIVGGLVWGYATLLSGRVVPAMISHAAFTYFSVMQFRPGL